MKMLKGTAAHAELFMLPHDNEWQCFLFILSSKRLHTPATYRRSRSSLKLQSCAFSHSDKWSVTPPDWLTAVTARTSKWVKHLLFVILPRRWCSPPNFSLTNVQYSRGWAANQSWAKWSMLDFLRCCCSLIRGWGPATQGLSAEALNSHKMLVRFLFSHFFWKDWNRWPDSSEPFIFLLHFYLIYHFDYFLAAFRPSISSIYTMLSLKTRAPVLFWHPSWGWGMLRIKGCWRWEYFPSVTWNRLTNKCTPEGFFPLFISIRGVFSSTLVQSWLPKQVNILLPIHFRKCTILSLMHCIAGHHSGQVNEKRAANPERGKQFRFLAAALQTDWRK